jgi:glutathione S-transferase
MPNMLHTFIVFSSDPSKRMRGAFGYIGLLSLLVFSIITALKLLGWIG